MISGAIVYFLGTIAVTLLITYFAARSSEGRESFYAASARIGAGQNGLAIAGDFMSATTMLGITGLYFMSGLDSLIYYGGALTGMALILMLIAGPLRRMGRFTLGDVIVARLKDPRLRLLSGVSTIVISLFYLVAQLVGAGGLIALLFGVPFVGAVIVVGVLMTIYVVFGGMLAATWVQIVKAVLLTTGIAVLSALCLVKGDGLAQLYVRAAEIHALGARLFSFGGLKFDAFATASLCFSLLVGMMGLPHLLIRFFTVPDARTARRSVVVGSGIIGVVFMLLFVVIGPASVVFVEGAPAFHDEAGKLVGGTNMVIIHLARAVGGAVLAGAIAAVAFATILAVVAGLSISIASAASHDLFGALKRGAYSEKQEMAIFRLSSFAASAIAIGLSILLQHENVAFLIALAFTIAASATFPVLICVLYWRGMTAAGAWAGGVTGLVFSLALIAVGPTFWVKVMGFESALFPVDYPALVITPLAFGVIWLVSRLTRPAVQT